MKPLTDLLRSRNIRYRWGFPLALTATHNGTTATLSSAEDVRVFTSALDLPDIYIPDWYGPLQPPNRLQMTHKQRGQTPSKCRSNDQMHHQGGPRPRAGPPALRWDPRHVTTTTS
ncbi:Hypothetical predicted protein [Pelobates cultripes]|uniref:Uncharacterized protein n=1 Tax=Pelobates cultripes TaxID=61616 RepID=A0AAD1QX54_PELCU|nr:Hypothetical predicted protein [Pelobates cultripes]